MWNFSSVNKPLAVGWSYMHSRAEWPRRREACLQEPNTEESEYNPADGLPATHTHTNMSNTLLSVTSSVWWHSLLQSQSSDIRGLDWEESPCVRWAAVTTQKHTYMYVESKNLTCHQISPDVGFHAELISLALHLNTWIKVSICVGMLFCRLFQIYFSSSVLLWNLTAASCLPGIILW